MAYGVHDKLQVLSLAVVLHHVARTALRLAANFHGGERALLKLLLCGLCGRALFKLIWLRPSLWRAHDACSLLRPLG